MTKTTCQPFRLPFKIWSSVLVFVTLLFTGISVSAQFQGASLAKRGNGVYRNNIYWINWDLNNDGRPGDFIASTNGTGLVRTATTPQGIVYTITITKINGNNNSISSYVPGQYDYDDLKTGYNWFTQAINTNGPTNTTNGYMNGYDFAGGTITNAYDNATDAHNSVIGITNTTPGQFTNFKISVKATLGGNPLNILGMVAAGAESLSYNGSTDTEYETFFTYGNIWQAFERVQNNFQGPARATSFVSLAQVNTLGKNVVDRSRTTGAQGPGAVLWFSRGADSINVELKGGGRQAVAIGFMVAEDYGDAPNTYGNVHNGLDVVYNGGAVPTENRTFPMSTFQLATLSAPLSSLGQIATVDAFQPFSDDLLGDDNNDTPNDEDALPNPYSSTVVNGANSLGITVPVRNDNTFDMRVWGWVDINLDGEFQLNERSSVFGLMQAGSSGSVNVNFENLPGAFAPFKKYPLRLRLVQAGGLPADNTSTSVDDGSIGFAASGEVEDHFVKIPDTDLSGSIFVDPNRNGVLDADEELYSNSDMCMSSKKSLPV